MYEIEFNTTWFLMEIFFKTNVCSKTEKACAFKDWWIGQIANVEYPSDITSFNLFSSIDLKGKVYTMRRLILNTNVDLTT